MYEHVYLYNLKSEKLIFVQSYTNEITNEIQTTFEKLINGIIQENKIQNINSDNEIIIKNNKANKFYTSEGNYFSFNTTDIFAGIFTLQKNNEEIYQNLVRDLSSDENFIVFSDDSEKIRALIHVYLNKYFSKMSPAIESNPLTIKDTLIDNNKDKISENRKINIIGKKTIFVCDGLETEVHDLKEIELPKNYTNNKNLRLFLILLFVFVGIGLAIILPFVI